MRALPTHIVIFREKEAVRRLGYSFVDVPRVGWRDVQKSVVLKGGLTHARLETESERCYFEVCLYMAGVIFGS